LSSHVLDRPAWSALNGRQAEFAVWQGAAVRFSRGIGMFVAAETLDGRAVTDISRLIADTGPVVIIETGPPPRIPGSVIVTQGPLWQMVAERAIEAPSADLGVKPLGDADSEEMVALAKLTEPGPFHHATHRLGRFIGIRHDGRLAAMAGERMRPDGHIEVSAVCTHPDFRGRGYGAALTSIVASRIQGEGQTAFLHVYASNRSAISLYETLGFRLRKEMIVTFLTPAE
jgi:ribosomal protein S18 acetylase RimI-like enzyme